MCELVFDWMIILSLIKSFKNHITEVNSGGLNLYLACENEQTLQIFDSVKGNLAASFSNLPIPPCPQEIKSSNSSNVIVITAMKWAK